VKRLSLVAVVAGFAACAHGQVVMAPDGQPATVVTCNFQHKCYAKAERLCPWGFQVLDERLGTLLFRCPYPSGPPLPPAPPPAPGQAPNAPAAPGSAPATAQEKLYHT
jgi:hypothetical protein